MESKNDLDQYYLKGLAAGDVGVVEQIYDQYFRGILHWVSNNSGSREDAEDIFQEAMVVLYQKTRSGSFMLTSSFFTFLFAVCKNLWKKQLRKRSRMSGDIEKQPDQEDPDGQILEMIYEREEQTLFRSVFEALDEGCKALLGLFFQGASMQEIMDKLGLSSISYTKKKKFLCKEKLVKGVQKDPRFRELKSNGYDLG